MKGSKEFDVNQFVDDGSRTSHETIVSGASQSEQSERDVQAEQPKQAQFTGKTASSVSNEPIEQILPVGDAGQTKPSKQTAPTRRSVSTQSVERMQYTGQTLPTQSTQQRTSSRQRKATLEEYRETFMFPPKIIDRQPVFVSREVRDRIDGIVRRFGERKMSVSGFLENLARHHLEDYADDLEQWKRL